MTKIQWVRLGAWPIIALIGLGLFLSGVSAGSYQLGAGDILQISVWGHPELTTTIEVRPDGCITFPLVGDHYASEKTTTQLAAELQAQLADYVIEPSVTAMVKEFRKINVQVLGEVRNPGYYSLRTAYRLMDAIGLAGGPTPDADLSLVTITRIESASTLILRPNAGKYINEGDLDQNPILQDQDVIYISAAGNVLILGAVKSPGSYRLQAEMDLLDLIAAGGGILDSGDLSQVTLTRKTNGLQQEYLLNLSQIIADGKGSWKIQPNDVLYIPEKQQITLFGAVNSPGNYPLETGKTLAEMIGKAGGLTNLGDASQISIIRTTQGNQDLLRVDISNVILGKASGVNPVLTGGDIVYIPEARNTVLVLGQVRNPGSFILKDQMGVLDLLALAGDTTDQAALERATLTRQVGEEILVQEIDIALLKQAGEGRQTQVVPGDVLFIPEGAPQAFILGSISKPGAYRVHSNTKLLDLLATAGGVLTTVGDEILITRDGKTTEVSLYGLMKFGFGDQVVKPGDVIYATEGKHQFAVLGEVRNPGYYHLDYEDRVLDGLAKAGGLTQTAARSQVTLTRVDEEGENSILGVDVHKLETNKYLPENYPLTGGDIIIVPKAGKVMVLGEVRNPGSYQFEEGLSIMDLMGAAGGLTEAASAAQVRLTRWEQGVSTSFEYNLTQPVEGRGGINPLLMAGDVVVVPKENREVLVLGAVARPGVYDLDKNSRALDLIGKAGGLDESADPVFTITRSEDGICETWSVDYLSLVGNLAHEDNRQLTGGDVLYVPEKNRRVLVFGEVQRPGAYLVDSYTSVLDVLALAGGVTDQASLGEISVTSIDGHLLNTTDSFDLLAVIDQRAPNVFLSGGEVIYVPRTQQVLVLGEVARPGTFTLATGARILDLVALAGGLKTNTSLQEIVLTRQTGDGDQVWLVDYSTLMSSQSQHNHLLQGGDVIFIPELKRQVLVLGEVERPGVYTIYEGARVLDAIALAGGPKTRAELSAVGIYRDGSVDLAAQLVLGRDKVLFQGDAGENPEILGGDIIFVPETTKPDWNAIFGILGGIRTFQQIIGPIFDWLAE